MQTAVKNLLGVAEGTSICIRFADSPFATVSDVAAVLQEPNHIVNLIVSVLPRPTNDTAEHEVPLNPAKEQDTCDPYCKYRRLYPARRSVNNDSTREGGLVRTKCNFAEMNKLLSQLADVSLSLQRTQHECDEIAKRCRRKDQMRSSSTGALSSKRVDPHQEQHDGAVSLQELATVDVVTDANVEKLLGLAESLTQRIIHQQKKSSTNGTAGEGVTSFTDLYAFNFHCLERKCFCITKARLMGIAVVGSWYTEYRLYGGGSELCGCMHCLELLFVFCDT